MDHQHHDSGAKSPCAIIYSPLKQALQRLASEDLQTLKAKVRMLSAFLRKPLLNDPAQSMIELCWNAILANTQLFAWSTLRKRL